ncbi:MAG: adenine deaminase, partial [Planctomycetota bacterium]
MRTQEHTQRLLAVARGSEPAGTMLRNARIVNVFTGEVLPGDVGLCGGRIAWVSGVDGQAGPPREAQSVIDLEGSYVAPGLIDAHMHVESTMMPPSEFVTLSAPNGTTTVIADPHEIANVVGIPGIRWMMRNAEGLPIDIRFAASSCVPSCHLETSGAALSADDLEPLFDDDRIIALAEMMNFPGVVHGDEQVLRKVALGLERRIVDGHCPGLRGTDLQAYVSAGISSDHESTDLEEAREKLRLGLRVYVREGSAARNLEALLPLITPANQHRFSWCTDDRHPDDLRREGHIDHVVRKAIAGGLDPVVAIAIGSLHTARHYGLRDTGAVAPGHHADLIVFDDLQQPQPRMTFFRGELVARDGTYLRERTPLVDPPVGTVTLPDVDAAALGVPVQGSRIRVIGMDPHQLITQHLEMDARFEGGLAVADPDRDLLKLVVMERHGGSGAIGRGFVTGFSFRGGALASTVGHDAHNLAIVGDNDADMLLAARELERVGGGQCVVGGGEVKATLPLPIAGLMSDQPSDVLI